MNTITRIQINDVNELQHVTFGSDGLVMVRTTSNGDVLDILAPVAFWIEAAAGARRVNDANEKISLLGKREG